MIQDNSPFFSICIPVYNGEHYISSTIRSILSQSESDFELIIVDNASTDRTSLLVAQFNDQRIRVISQKQTVPAHENWSTAVMNARGLWTKLVCADDILTSNSLEVLREKIRQNPSAKVISGRRNVIDEFDREILSAKKKSTVQSVVDRETLLKSIICTGTNTIGEPLCVAWKSELTKLVGNFSSQWNYFVDLDYWIRLTEFSAILKIPDHLGSFRVSTTSWTSSLGLRTISEAREFMNSEHFRSDFGILARIFGVGLATQKAYLRKMFLTLLFISHASHKRKIMKSSSTRD